MQVLQKLPNGTFAPVDVPDNEVSDRFLAGQVYFHHPEQEVHVRLSDGRIGSIQAKDAERFFNQGASVVDPETFHKAYIENKYGGPAGAVKAAVAGGARGLSMGGSDVLATGLARAFGGSKYANAVREQLAGTKEANPWISVGTEAAGMAIPSIFGGEEAAAAKAPELLNELKGAAQGVKAEGPAARAAAEGFPGAVEALRPAESTQVDNLSKTAALNRLDGIRGIKDATEVPELTSGRASTEALNKIEQRRELAQAQLNFARQKALQNLDDQALRRESPFWQPQFGGDPKSSLFYSPGELPPQPAIHEFSEGVPLPPPGEAPPTVADALGVTEKEASNAGLGADTGINSADVFGMETPTNMKQAAVHSASRISDFMRNTPAGLMARAGTATRGIVDEVFGKDVADSTIGKVLAGAVREGLAGSLEVGLQQMGNEVSEDTLGDHELNAQKLLYAFGHGALMGAAFGSVMGPVGALATDAAFRLLEKVAPFTSKAAELQAYRAFSSGGGRGIERDAIRAFGQEAPYVLGRAGLKYVLRGGGAMSIRELAEKTDEVVNEMTSNLEDRIMQLDADAKPGDRVKLADVVAKLMGGKDELMETLKEFSQAHGHIVGLSNTEQMVLDKLVKEEEPLRRVLRTDARQEHRDAYIKWLHSKGADEDLRNDLLTAENAAREKKELAEKAYGDTLGQIQDLRNKHENSFLNKIINGSETIPGGLKSYFDESGTATFAKAREARLHIQKLVHTFTPDPSKGYGNLNQNVLRKVRGALEEAIVDSADKLSGRLGKTTGAEYKSIKDDLHKLLYLKKKAEQSLAADFKNQHFSLTGKMLAASIGIGTHSIPAAIMSGIAHKLIRDRGTTASALIMDKLNQLAFIQKANARVDRAMEQGADGLMKRIAGKDAKGVSRKLRVRVNLPKSPKDATEARDEGEKNLYQVTALAGQPSVKAQHVANALGMDETHAPKTMLSMARGANTVTQYLMAQIPKGHTNYQDITGPHPGRTSDSELAEFNEKHTGATDIFRSMDKVAKGRVTSHLMDGMKANPKVLDQFRQVVAGKLAEMSPKDRANIPFQNQIELGLIFDQPPGWSFQPGPLKSLQAADIQITQSDGRPILQQTPGRMAPARMQRSSFSKGMSTPIEKIDSTKIGENR